MTTLQAPPADSQAAAHQADVAVLEALLQRPVGLAERVGAGRNSRVYHVCCEAGEYAAKFYFGPTADGRDRLEIEFSALDFLWRRGVHCVPQPLHADRAHHVALYEFVAGEQIDARHVSSSDVDQLLSFLAQLHRIARDPDAHGLPAAAEAFFTVPEVIGNLHTRLERLENAAGEGEAYADLRRFLRDAFMPALGRFAGRAESAGLGELAPECRTLSPSDLGFHNALRDRRGNLTFLDFEYFGWDDPVKTLCDAELHPRMQLALGHRRRLAAGFDRIFGGDPHWRDRVDALYPLFALKWCLIMLNEFRAEQIARRRYVDRNQDRVAVIQQRQLEAARTMLARVVSEQGRFPYWEDNA